MSRVAVIVTAAGSSRRFGGGNKLLQPLNGRPVLAWTLQAFEACLRVNDVYVTAPPEDEAVYRDWLARVAPRTGREVIVGGAERQQSIFLALQRLFSDPPSLVAVHDGARPLLSQALLEALLGACHPGQGAVPGFMPTDTIKRVVDGRVQETLDRPSLVAVQTPQVFPWDMLWAAHARAADEGVVATDDAALVERCGGMVQVVAGDPHNIKLTVPADLWQAERWLSESAPSPPLPPSTPRSR